MKNDKIERSVKRAFVNAAPYQLDKVTEKCKEQLQQLHIRTLLLLQ